MGSDVCGLRARSYGASVAAEGVDADGNAESVDSERRPRPYASSYGVTPDMLQYDKDRGVCSEEKGYTCNPTTVGARDNAWEGEIVDHEGKPRNGSYAYAC